MNYRLICGPSLTETFSLCNLHINGQRYVSQTQENVFKSKGKMIPLQARCGPEGG